MEQRDVNEVFEERERRYRALAGWMIWHLRQGERRLVPLWQRWHERQPLNMGSKT